MKHGEESEGSAVHTLVSWVLGKRSRGDIASYPGRKPPHGAQVTNRETSVTGATTLVSLATGSNRHVSTEPFDERS